MVKHNIQTHLVTKQINSTYFIIFSKYYGSLLCIIALSTKLIGRQIYFKENYRVT